MPRRRLQQRQRNITIDDLRFAAYSHWPRAVRDYVEGGADAERSLSLNLEAFRRFTFLPRVLSPVGEVDLASSFCDGPSALPFGLAPTGYSKVIHAEGERGVASAAARAGVPYIVSMMATTPVEEIAREGADLWFQLYVTRDRKGMNRRLGRAREAGCRVLVVTVDSPVTGNRVRDLHNDLVMPPPFRPFASLWSGASPRWLLGYWRSQPVTFALFEKDNIRVRLDTERFSAQHFDPNLYWHDIEALRRTWTGPLLLKGVSHPDDAKRAVQLGVDGLVVSNHGGRQLDASIPPLLALPAVRAAVGDEVPVYIDSGIRRGSDVALAIALGASGCFIGRAYLYGLGAAGRDGCTRAIDILAEELTRTMRLLGIASVWNLRAKGAALVADGLVEMPNNAEQGGNLKW